MPITINVGTGATSGVNASVITSGILPVARGGTGTSTSTGSGNAVLSDGPTVNGTITVNGNVIANSGTNALPSLTFAGNTSTGLYLPAANIVGFSCGGTESGQISAQGLVMKSGSNASPSITFSGNTSTGISLTSANTISISTAGTERMRLDGTGNVIANVIYCSNLFHGTAMVKTFSFVPLLTGTLYTTTYRYSANFYENITIVAPNQFWGVDSQWYTIPINANYIGEQVVDALTYYLKNRPIGSTHEIVMLTTGDATSQGGRILAVKTSSSGGIMYGFTNWTQRTFTFTY